MLGWLLSVVASVASADSLVCGGADPANTFRTIPYMNWGLTPTSPHTGQLSSTHQDNFLPSFPITWGCDANCSATIASLTQPVAEFYLGDLDWRQGRDDSTHPSDAPAKFSEALKFAANLSITTRVYPSINPVTSNDFRAIKEFYGSKSVATAFKEHPGPIGLHVFACSVDRAKAYYEAQVDAIKEVLPGATDFFVLPLGLGFESGETCDQCLHGDCTKEVDTFMRDSMRALATAKHSPKRIYWFSAYFTYNEKGQEYNIQETRSESTIQQACSALAIPNTISI